MNFVKTKTQKTVAEMWVFSFTFHKYIYFLFFNALYDSLKGNIKKSITSHKKTSPKSFNDTDYNVLAYRSIKHVKW